MDFSTIRIRKEWLRRLKQIALEKDMPLWQVLDDFLKQALKPAINEGGKK